MIGVLIVVKLFFSEKINSENCSIISNIKYYYGSVSFLKSIS